MSLLWMEYEADFQNLAEDAFHRACEADPAYFSRLTPKFSAIIRRDTRYNVDFLYTAYLLGEDKIMEGYAVWLYQLMASVLKGKIPAGKTEQYVLEHLDTYQPDLIALSVTMPQRLMACRDMVSALRTRHPHAKIAVGGKAFESTHDLWKQWPIDLYAPDARQLLTLANELC